MPTQLTLHKTFAECESEELQRIERLQGQFHVFLSDETGELIALSSNMQPDRAHEFLQAVDFVQLKVADRPQITRVLGIDLFYHRNSDGLWCFEFDPLTPQIKPLDIRLDPAMPNVVRYAQTMCDELHALLPYDRVLVYRFSEDESGEVIAEKIDPGMEPFIGLHYPATDIPRQARALYAQTPARMVFSNLGSDVTLVGPNGQQFDLTHIVSRGVSPYHLSYLQNMGSLSTASVAIAVDGKLWGLLSMHSETEVMPTADLYMTLSQLKNQLSERLSEYIALSEQGIVLRNQSLLDRFQQHLSSEFDLAYSLLLGSFAVHRMVGGVGAAVIVGEAVAQVGETPQSSVSRELFRRLQSKGKARAFCDSVYDEPDIARARLGGYAYVEFSAGAEAGAGLLIFRRQVTQSVSWGGDPRNLAINEGKSPTYTPRASFERWTELVQGQCLPWEKRTVELLEAMILKLSQRFESTGGALGPLLGYSLQQLVHNRSKILQRLNDQFEQLREGMAIAIQTGDSEPRSILSINYAASIAFNMSAQEAEGMGIEDFVQTTNIPFEALESGSISQVSVWTNDAGHRDLQVEVQQQFDFQNPITGESISIQVFCLTDITQSKRVELALHAAYRKSEKLAAAQNETFAKLMHEMRTPLNSIIGFSSFLSDETLSESERNDFLERVVRNAQALQSLLDQSREQAHILRRDIEAASETCSLGKLIQEVSDDLTLSANERALSIRLELPQSEVWVNGARASIRQIVINLLSNAMKFSNPGQSIEIHLEQDRDFAILRVEDSGMGMTTQQAASATEPFVRFSDRPGSGLGLSIVNQLIQANGGQLTIESELGKGTRVETRIPLAVNRMDIQKPVAGLLVN